MKGFLENALPLLSQRNGTKLDSTSLSTDVALRFSPEFFH